MTSAAVDPELDPDVSALLRRLEASAARLGGAMSMPESRLAFDREVVDETTDMPGVASVTLAAELEGVCRLVRVYRSSLGTPSSGPAAPGILFLHGGGWCIGGLESHDWLCRRLAVASRAVVVSLDYRLAPEHPYPAGLNDVRAAVSWLIDRATELGIDPERLALAGDSAGGNLAAAVALDDARISFQLLLNPVLDLAMDSASYDRFGEGYLLTRAAMQWFAAEYLGPDGRSEAARLTPAVSPLRAADVSAAPPALVVTAACDPLRDEAEAYAVRLAEVGVSVRLWRVPGMVHGYLLRPRSIGAVPSLVDRIGDQMRLGLTGARWTTNLALHA